MPLRKEGETCKLRSIRYGIGLGNTTTTPSTATVPGPVAWAAEHSVWWCPSLRQRAGSVHVAATVWRGQTRDLRCGRFGVHLFAD